MMHSGTDPQVFDEVIAFAKAIGMIALPLYKEQPGYILNTLLVPVLSLSLNLLVNGVSDVETIDKTWMKAMMTPLGPFAILDMVGITTAYNILKMEADTTKDPIKIKSVAYLKENFIDKNKLGSTTGEGFYKYPHPAYKNSDFLK
ncbi:3-hydroxybutyryl-CoA dehydrogenase [Winogradskyella psychrotolerans RS-3]|uniref:3-hydroxybutyryl-CoA dehydrogenase n=1 Tax=Winogradskyella psychrotolerans RS-3 TaxID=641526 RepID=S7WZY9_9FLAO|nr:3-hydroxybutyryl-CoA dehydrogenase [Winogradskyella psychrotolerans RS-3]